MLDGQSRLVSIAPKDALAELGAAAGEERGGVFFAKNSCPSQGTMDVFVEPVLPSPRLLILGASPVAVALARLAPSMGFDVAVAASPEEHERFGPGVRRHVGVAAAEAGYTKVYAQCVNTRPKGTIERTFITRIDRPMLFRAALAGAYDSWEEWY